MDRLFREGIRVRYDFSEDVLGNQVIDMAVTNLVMHFTFVFS